MVSTKTKCVLKQNKTKHTRAPKQTGPKNKMGLTRGGALKMTPTHLKENKTKQNVATQEQIQSP